MNPNYEKAVQSVFERYPVVTSKDCEVGLPCNDRQIAPQANDWRFEVFTHAGCFWPFRFWSRIISRVFAVPGIGLVRLISCEHDCLTFSKIEGDQL